MPDIEVKWMTCSPCPTEAQRLVVSICQQCHMCIYTNINSVLLMEVYTVTRAWLTLLGGNEVEWDGQSKETCTIKDTISARFWKMCSHSPDRQGFKQNFKHSKLNS